MRGIKKCSDPKSDPWVQLLTPLTLGRAHNLSELDFFLCNMRMTIVFILDGDVRIE